MYKWGSEFINVEDMTDRVDELRDMQQDAFDKLQEELDAQQAALEEQQEELDAKQAALEERQEGLRAAALNAEDAKELELLESALEKLKGYGGDHKWRGKWYPSELISDHAFAGYVKELITDCGDVPSDLPSYIEIDWDATTDNVRVDYSYVKINDTTYWYR